MDRETRELLTELLGARQTAGVPPESETAMRAAKLERETDPNRLDRKHTQDRMDEAVHGLRVRMGLEKA
jgi:hypothetical protein